MLYNPLTMSTYRKKGSLVFTMDFQFQGQRIKETTGVRTKQLADRVERERRRGLEEGRTGLKKVEGPQLFQAVAVAYLEMKSATLSKNGYRIESTNLNHIYKTFGKTFVNSIEADDIAAYQKKRIADGYANKTVNLEVGTIRSVLIYCNQWARIQGEGSKGGKKVKTLKTRDDFGISLTSEQESKLLEECSKSQSRSLIVIAIVALHTGARFGVVSKLKWSHVDFAGRTLKWGKDKTDSGDHRTVPMSNRIVESLKMWAENFPDRKASHYVFPSEKYGRVGHKFGREGDASDSVVYGTDPSQHIGSIKTAWEGAQSRSGIKCRVHDLRHTAVSRMLESGVPFMMVARIVGWSAANTILMAKRYGHFSQNALRGAMESINLTSPLKSHPFEAPTHSVSSNLLI